MEYVLIVHDVENYEAWKDIFDAAAEIRAAAGEIRFQVLSSTGDPNRIVHFSRWTSAQAARQFFESDDLVRIRQAAGVKSPQFLYLQERDAGDLTMPRPTSQPS